MEYRIRREDIEIQQRVFARINNRPEECIVLAINALENQKWKISVKRIDRLNNQEYHTIEQTCSRDDGWGWRGFFPVFNSLEDMKAHELQEIEKTYATL